MDGRRLYAALRRLRAGALRLGIDRIPRTRSLYRWLVQQTERYPEAVTHHGFDLVLTPKMVSSLVDTDGVAYERDVDVALRTLAAPGDVALDIGGFVGYHTLALRRAVGPSGRVIVFEPLPANAELLAHTIRANGFANVTLERIAVGASSGRTAMSAPSGDWSIATTATAYEDSRAVDVETVPLPEYLAEAGIEQVDVAKIDVEGGEYAILCETDALASLDALVCELHPTVLDATEIDEIIDRLSATGTLRDLENKPLERAAIRNGPAHVVWTSH